MVDEKTYRFDAFISYSRQNPRSVAVTARLQKDLEKFQLPKVYLNELANPEKTRLNIFRDETDIGLSSDLTQEICDHLRASRHLIVIASPAAVKSRWVPLEIEYFKKIHQDPTGERITVILADGEGKDAIPLPLKDGGRIPNYGDMTERKKEKGEGWFVYRTRMRKETLRCLASMFVITFDELWNRDQIRRLRQLCIIAVLALVVIFSEAGFGLFSFQQWLRARRAQRQTAETLGKSDFLEGLHQLQNDESNKALAYFARAVKIGGHAGAQSRIVSMLKDRNWLLSRRPALRHDLGLADAEFSPDGKMVLTRGADKGAAETVKVWRTETGTLAFPPISSAYPLENAFFTTDSSRLVTVGLLQDDRRMVQFYDAATGKPSRQEELNLAHVSLPILSMEGRSAFIFSGDGRHVAVFPSDRSVRAFDLDSRRWTSEPIQLPLPVTSARFGEDGRRFVVTCGIDVDAFNIQELFWAALDGSADKRKSVKNGWARVFDASSGKPVSPELWHQGKVMEGAFSPDGSRLFTLSCPGGKELGGYGNLWNITSGTLIAKPIYHENQPLGAEFSPDGLILATFGGASSRDGQAFLWNGLTGQAIGDPIRHKEWVRHAHFSADGRILVTVCDNGFVRLWNPLTGHLLAEPIMDDRPFRDAQFSLNGKTILTWTSEEARLWDVQFLHPATHSTSLLACQAAALSPDGGRIALALGYNAAPGKVEIRSLHDDRPIAELPHGKMVRCVEFSRDGDKLSTGCGDFGKPEGYAQVWRLHDGTPLTKPLKHDGNVRLARLSPDGNTLLTCEDFSSDVSKKSRARLWRVSDGSLISDQLEHEDNLKYASFSPDGSRVATASDDTTARIWDARTGRPLTPPLRHASPVNCCAFTPDGRQLLTASGLLMQIGKIRFWDADSGSESRSLISYRASFQYVSCSPDGKRLLAFAQDHSVHVWDRASGVELFEPVFYPRRVTSARFDETGRLLLVSVGDNSMFPGWVDVLDAFTGSAVVDRIPSAKPVVNVFLSASARKIVSVTIDGANFSEFLPPEEQAPAWLPTLAECVGGMSLQGETSTPNMVSGRHEHLSQIQAHLAEDSLLTSSGTVARWLLRTPDKRSITSFTSQTLAGRVAELMKERTNASMKEALDLNPDNPEALANLWSSEARLQTFPEPALTPKEGESDIQFAERYFAAKVEIQRLQLKYGENAYLATPAARARADWLTDLACRMGPKNAEVWRVRANFLNYLGRPERALPAFEKALSLGAKDSAIRNLQANILGKLNRHDECKAAYSEAIRLEEQRKTPDWNSLSTYYINLANLYVILGAKREALNDFMKAFQAFERSIGDKPAFIDVIRVSLETESIMQPLLKMGQIREGLAIVRKGKELLNRLANREPSLKGEMMTRRLMYLDRYEGFWLLLNGKKDEAEKIFCRILDGGPNQPDAQKSLNLYAKIGLAHCRLLDGQYDQAMTMYQSVYQSVASLPLAPAKTGKQLILDDLGTMRTVGIDHPNIRKAQAALGGAAVPEARR